MNPVISIKKEASDINFCPTILNPYREKSLVTKVNTVNDWQRGNALIICPILLISSLTKYMEISWEKLSLDIGA